MITTTLNLIEAKKPCSSGYSKLIAFLSADYDKEKPINFLTILESNGVLDCVWAFQCARETKAKKILALIAIEIAESVLPIFEKKYPTDFRPRNALINAKKFLNKKITQKKLTYVVKNAYDAIDDAVNSVYNCTACNAACVTWSACNAACNAARAVCNAACVTWSACDAAAYVVRTAARTTQNADAQNKKHYEIVKKYLSS